MSLYAINKGIPIPITSRGDAQARRKYPFDELEIGDMFFIPSKEGKTKNTLSTHTSTVGKALGKKFVTRMTYMTGSEDEGWTLASKGDEGAVLGIGVWRDELPAPKAPAEAAVDEVVEQVAAEAEPDEEGELAPAAPPAKVARGGKRH